MILYESAILIKLYHIPQSQLQSFQSHISPQHYKYHNPLLLVYLERLCLQTKSQPLLEAFGSKEARYCSLFAYYYFLMIETLFYCFFVKLQPDEPSLVFLSCILSRFFFFLGRFSVNRETLMFVGLEAQFFCCIFKSTSWTANN